MDCRLFFFEELLVREEGGYVKNFGILVSFVEIFSFKFIIRYSWKIVEIVFFLFVWLFKK